MFCPPGCRDWQPSAMIAEWLRLLYPPDPGDADWIGSMQPDRLAELHTLRELIASPQLTQSCLTNLDARREKIRAVALLARASSDYPEAENLLGHILPNVAGFLAGMEAPLAEILTAILNAIPYPTVVLAPAAVSLGQRGYTSNLPTGADAGGASGRTGSRVSETAFPNSAATPRRCRLLRRPSQSAGNWPQPSQTGTGPISPTRWSTWVSRSPSWAASPRH